MNDQLALSTNLFPTVSCQQLIAGKNIQVHSAWACFPETSHLNLAGHTGADSKDVLQARNLLQAQLPGVQTLTWLNQQHTTTVTELTGESQSVNLLADTLVADAAVTTLVGQACVVLTADCVPILLVDPIEPRVAAIHAGWRGLANGIVENTLQYFHNAAQVHAYIGPCISQPCFEVGQDVFDCFIARSSCARDHFLPSSNEKGKWFADLPGLAAEELVRLGLSLENITQSGICTFSDAHLPSYRLNKTASRMASVVWLSN